MRKGGLGLGLGLGQGPGPDPGRKGRFGLSFGDKRDLGFHSRRSSPQKKLEKEPTKDFPSVDIKELAARMQRMEVDIKKLTSNV